MFKLLFWLSLAWMSFAQTPIPSPPQSPQSPPSPPSPQSLPSHFFALGTSYSSTPSILPAKWAGFLSACTTLPSSNSTYVCAATDFSGPVSSTRAGVETILFYSPRLVFTLKADAGIATGANSSTGASYGTGLSILLPLSKLGMNSYLVFSISWLKNNVAASTATSTSSPTPSINSPATAVKWWGDHAILRIGFGKGY